VPVIIVFTKFDMVVSQVLLESESRSSQQREHARAMAYTQYQQSCRSLFLKEASLREVPTEIVSGSI
jgi:hypothetical protein